VAGSRHDPRDRPRSSIPATDAQGTARVEEAHIAFDCGTFVNRDTVVTQAQGAVLFALSGALHGKITARAGAIEQSNFHDYPLLRMHEMPAIEVHIVPSTDAPGGVGESGVPAVAHTSSRKLCGSATSSLASGSLYCV
jgi:isoquinoline 1-oxidoreductase beta subunit